MGTSIDFAKPPFKPSIRQRRARARQRVRSPTLARWHDRGSRWRADQPAVAQGPGQPGGRRCEPGAGRRPSPAYPRGRKLTCGRKLTLVAAVPYDARPRVAGGRAAAFRSGHGAVW